MSGTSRGADPEPLGDARAEALEHDVCTGAEGLRERSVRLQVADDRLGAGAERRVPRGRGRAHRVALGGLHAHDAGASGGEARGSRMRRGGGASGRRRGFPRAVAPRGSVPLSSAALTDRSIASEEKRKSLLDAAVRVFARTGYHGARVGDIAEEAGVAHGLLYHYFSSKEEVLQTIFRENWGELLERFRAVEAAEEPASEKLEGIAKILLRTWRNDPGLVTVMVREVARSQQLQSQVVEVREAFAIVQRVIEQGQREGVFRADVDARLASWILYGGLEEVLTGWVWEGSRPTTPSRAGGAHRDRPRPPRALRLGSAT